jgi:hypothetical protein
MTDADQLLLNWAKAQFPEYARDKVDKHNRYVEKTNAHNDRNPLVRIGISELEIIHAHTLAHLINCKPKISAVDHEWECGCYSEYTRDDSWVVHCRVSCAHGLITEMRVTLDSWRIPEVLQELADMDEGCGYDNNDPDY